MGGAQALSCCDRDPGQLRLALRGVRGAARRGRLVSRRCVLRGALPGCPARSQVVLFGCTGPLPDYPLPGGVSPVHSRRVLLDYVAATVPRGKVGVLVPAPLQVEATRRGYRAPGREVDVRAVSPADREAVLATAAMLGADGAQLVVLGCFDHTLSDLRAARAVTGRPVTSSRQLAIGALRDLLAGPQPWQHVNKFAAWPGDR